MGSAESKGSSKSVKINKALERLLKRTRAQEKPQKKPAPGGTREWSPYKTPMTEQEYNDYLEDSVQQFNDLYKDDPCKAYDLRCCDSEGRIEVDVPYGDMYVLRLRSTGEPFVAKRYLKEKLNTESVVEQVMNKKKIAYALQNRFIIEMIAAWRDSKFLYMFYVYADLGPLALHYRGACQPRVVAQLILAFEYLHNIGIVHRNLNLDTVLVCNDLYIKLAGFGLCKWIKKNRTSTLVGPVSRMAPELVKKKKYGFEFDYWLLGLLTYQMVYDREPFARRNEDETKRAILEDEPRLPLRGTVARMGYIGNKEADMCHIIDSCLIKDRKNRLGVANGWDDAKKLHCFKDIDFMDVFNKTWKHEGVVALNTRSLDWRRKEQFWETVGEDVFRKDDTIFEGFCDLDYVYDTEEPNANFPAE